MLYITRDYDGDDYEVIEVGETPDLRISDITVDDTVMISRCSGCGSLYAWTEDEHIVYESIRCPFCGTSYMQPYYDYFDDLEHDEWFDDDDDYCDFDGLDEIN